MADQLETWFQSEVLIHEEILMRFLARAWPRREDLRDLRQETYTRVYEAALQSRPQNVKAFVFSIARHIMVDRRRRERIVSIQAAGDNDLSNDLVDDMTPERRVGGHQELVRLAQAFDRLPAKCREVVWMRRVQSIAQKEVAECLGVSEKTVEHQLAKGSRLIAQFMLQGEEGREDSQTDRHTLDGETQDEGLR
jgi:RNA polymerase sigma-70 factor (ECF subfamily)